MLLFYLLLFIMFMLSLFLANLLIYFSPFDYPVLDMYVLICCRFAWILITEICELYKNLLWFGVFPYLDQFAFVSISFKTCSMKLPNERKTFLSWIEMGWAWRDKFILKISLFGWKSWVVGSAARDCNHAW